jgi:glutathione S-transferase
MKLYYMPGACSLAPHMLAEHLGLKLQLERVGRDKKTETGADYLEISPTGAVPLLKLDNGEILTENAAILQYLCEQSPKGADLVPKSGMERFRAIEWLSYVGTEIHKSMGILFAVGRVFPEGVQPQVTEGLHSLLPKKMDRLTKALTGKKYLMGDKMCAADIYLFVVLSWAPMIKLDLTKWPKLMAYLEMMRNLPAAQTAMAAEGLTGGKK